jgi:hypothetical protein
LRIGSWLQIGCLAHFSFTVDFFTPSIPRFLSGTGGKPMEFGYTQFPKSSICAQKSQALVAFPATDAV